MPSSELEQVVQAWSKHALVKCIGLETACFEAVQRGDELTVRSCLEGGGRANATREVRSKDGDVTTGVTLLMDAASGIPTVGSIWGTVGCGH